MGDMARSWRGSEITWRSNQYKCIGHEFGRPYQSIAPKLAAPLRRPANVKALAPILVYILEISWKRSKGNQNFGTPIKNLFVINQILLEQHIMG